MGKGLSSLLHRHEPRKVDRGYVSEFEAFINHFLEEHPEVVDDQRRGRALYWDHKVDWATREKAEQDQVPDSRYGFYYPTWHGTRADKPRKPGKST